MKTAFVTGGSGFMGRNLIRALIARGIEVVALARSEPAAAAIAAIGARAALGHLNKLDSLKAGMAGCDTVFHCAAFVKEWGPRAAFEVANVTGTELVVQAAKSAGVRRLVHVSTEAVIHGGRPLIGAEENWPYPKGSIGEYPRTKRLAEQIALAANGQDLEVVVIRPPFVWGKGDTSLLDKIALAVRQGRFTWVEGGHYPKSTCNVANACEGLILAAEKGRSGEIYFITDGPPTPLREFMTALLKTRGVDLPDRNIPGWAAGALAKTSEAVWKAFRLGGEPPLTRMALLVIGEELTVNDAKARRELGYSPIVTVEEGLAELTAEAAASRRAEAMQEA